MAASSSRSRPAACALSCARKPADGRSRSPFPALPGIRHAWIVKPGLDRDPEPGSRDHRRFGH